MTPIEKNIAVVDELGNEYEPTYPKRAKGLVKHGRARFLSEDRICLACPPDRNLEEHNMSNRIEETVQAHNEPIAETTAKAENNANELNLAYILEQIARIQSDTSYLNEAIQKLALMSDQNKSGPGSPPDVQGQAKAQALGSIVRCRETTNQQLLRFYEKLYDDWRADNSPSKDTKILFELGKLTKMLQDSGVSEAMPMIDAARELFERICKGQVQIV